MPTLDELRIAFDHLADGAPDRLAEPVRPTHRRRTAALLAAACTAAIAVGVPVALHNDTPSTSQPLASPTLSIRVPPPDDIGDTFTQALPAPADEESPDLAYGFAFNGPTAGYTIIPDAITRTYQSAGIYGPTDPPGGELFVFYRGEFDPASVTGRGAAATVNGRPAMYGDVVPPNGDQPLPVLAWEYADDGWAVLFLGTLAANGAPEDVGTPAVTARNALAVAEAMRPAHTTISVPVRVPSSLATRVDSISVNGSSDGIIELSDADTGRQWVLKWSAVPINGIGRTPQRINGHQWDLNSSLDGPGSLLLIGDGFGLTISTPGPVTTDELETFAAEIGIARNPSSRSTWFDASDALP